MEPSQLRVSFQVLPPSLPAGPGPASHALYDLSSLAQQLGARPGRAVGPLWGLVAAAGQVVELEVEAASPGGGGASCSAAADGAPPAAGSSVELSLVCRDLAGSDPPLSHGLRLSDSLSAAAGGGGGGEAAGAGGIAPGVLLTGACERLQLWVPQGGRACQRFSLLMVLPGLYQIDAGGISSAGCAVSGGGGGAGRQPPCTVDRLLIAVL
jgi:hypothetical protein